MVGDVGNELLEAYTKERVCFIAGREFGELEGCTLVINNALYGLRSRSRWHTLLGSQDLHLEDDGWLHENVWWPTSKEG